MIAIFDIETNGLYLELDTVHCISIKVDDEPTKVYTSKYVLGSDGTLEEGLDILEKADLIVGHNIINFDIPALKKVYPYWTYKACHDTLLMGRLAYPNLMLQDANRKTMPPKLKGSHSLKAWGYRLRKFKQEYEEQWEYLSVDMVEYCRQDSEVTYHLYKKLLTRSIPEEAIKLEQDFAKVISRQEKYGVYFDMQKAQALHVTLMQEAEEAEEELFKVFKPLQTWTPKNYPKVAYKKNGDKSQVLLNQELLGCHFNEDMEWGYFKEVHFNPTSRPSIARWLQEVYHWKPVEYTEKGSVVINEDVLDSLEFPEGKILAHYFNVKKLIGQLAEGNKAWMKQVRSNGRIHGSVNTLGAVTRRCTHSHPNMAQVPSGRAYKGHEARELFTVPSGKKLVGCDADGLELRTLSHYMARYDGGKYARTVDQGKKEDETDVHNVNKRGAGLSDRDTAKTFIYAFLYGAGDEKIGSIVGGSAETGRKLKSKFLRRIPAIKRLIEQVAEVYKRTGTIKALDGNPYHIRSAHSALNVLLQGAGALVMKHYLVFLDRNLSKEFTHSDVAWIGPAQYEFVLNVHDEVQIECDEAIAKRVAEICESSFDDVTEHLNFRIPIRGSADIGDSWAETH